MIVVPNPALAAAVDVSEFPRPLKVLVIDRQPLFTAVLGRLLGAAALSAEVGSSRRSDLGLEMVRTRPIDLVLCELTAEPISGRELADLLADEKPLVPVILLGDLDEEKQLAAALPSGAAGVFTKDASPDEFLAGVRAVLAGHRAISDGPMSQLVELTSEPVVVPPPPGSQLSPTELDIVTLVGRASSITAIAEIRGISSKTVRNHLASIYRKLELHGRTEAILWAARMGLTESSSAVRTTSHSS